MTRHGRHGSLSHRAARPRPLGGTEVFLALADPGFDPDQSADTCAVGRGAVPEPRSAGRPAVRWRPSRPAADRGRFAGAACCLPDRSDADPAPEAAGCRFLAAGFASVAEPSVGRRRRGRGDGAEGDAAAVRPARFAGIAGRDRRVAGGFRPSPARRGCRVPGWARSAGAWTSH